MDNQHNTHIKKKHTKLKIKNYQLTKKNKKNNKK